MKTLLVDYSYLYYRCKFAYRAIKKNIGGVVYDTGAAFGYQRYLRIFQEVYPKVVICLDGKPQKCLDIQDTYKGDREVDKATFEVSRSDVVELTLLFPGVEVWHHPEMEADEVIAFFTAMRKEPMDIFTTDMDIHQLIDDDRQIAVVNQFNSKARIFNQVREADVINKWGVAPDEIPIYKAIRGDKSDNIQGVYRFPHKDAIHLAQNYKTYDELEAHLIKHEKVYKKKTQFVRLYDALALVKQNYQMTRLNPLQIPYEYEYKKTPVELQAWRSRYLSR